MIYPVNHISISQGHHTGKCLDFGWWVEKYRYQPILACDSGKVKKTEKQPNGGNVIYLEHNDGTISCYAHLDKILVKKGQKVSLGQQIGTMGNSGKTTGMHLHFGLYSKGKNKYGKSDMDPFDYCYVYENQEVRTTGNTKNYLDKFKYHSTMTKYVNAKDGLNVRKSADLKSSIVNILPFCATVDVMETVGNFAKIGDNQYVYAKYLSDTKPDNSFQTKTVIATDGLNVRSNASLFASKVQPTPLPYGTIVAVMETKGSWTKISELPDRWVSSKYIK